ncbi:hypothetical protein ACFX5K_06140 [Rickettsiales bacterium LUAb2]
MGCIPNIFKKRQNDYHRTTPKEFFKHLKSLKIIKTNYQDRTPILQIRIADNMENLYMCFTEHDKKALISKENTEDINYRQAKHIICHRLNMMMFIKETVYDKQNNVLLMLFNYPGITLDNYKNDILPIVGFIDHIN